MLLKVCQDFLVTELLTRVSSWQWEHVICKQSDKGNSIGLINNRIPIYHVDTKILWGEFRTIQMNTTANNDRAQYKSFFPDFNFPGEVFSSNYVCSKQ